MMIASATTQQPVRAQREPLWQQVKTEAQQTSEQYADTAETVLGGAVGTIVLAGSLYAGVLGGAAVGAAFGGGIGPMIASVASSGALDFIATSFGAASPFVKAGMVIGGLATAAGAWKVGEKAGRLVARLPGKGVGYAVGAGKGAVNNWMGIPSPLPAEKVEKEQESPVKLSRPLQVVATAISGVGTLSGVVGGALIGAGVMGVGSLFAQGLTFGGAATAGAVVGGLAMGVAGAVGGYQFVKGIKAAITGSETAQRWLLTEQREEAVVKQAIDNDKTASLLEARRANLAEAALGHQQQLSEKESAVTKLEDEATFKAGHQDELVRLEADKLARTRGDEIASMRSDKSAREAALSERQGAYDEAMANLEEAVAERGAELVSELRQEKAEVIAGRTAELDARAARLEEMRNNPEAAIEAVVAEELGGMRTELEQIEARTEQYQAEKDGHKQRAGEEARRSEALDQELKQLDRDTTRKKLEARRLQGKAAEA